jgi:hypothetical protein
MTKKLKWIDAELAKQMEVDRPWISQGIKIHENLYKHLMKGLKVYCKIVNGEFESFTLASLIFRSSKNEDIKLFCICNRFNSKTYELLILSEVNSVEDLLNDKEASISRNWEKVRSFR